MEYEPLWGLCSFFVWKRKEKIKRRVLVPGKEVYFLEEVINRVYWCPAGGV
jgi:hypothetical protein